MSQADRPHSQPGSLDQKDQQQLIQDIGRVVLRGLPPGWQEASVEYRAVGRHAELAAQLSTPNGTVVPIAAPTEAQELFSQLRHGMHQSERGTWISALYQLQRPSSYSVDFNGDYEPSWQRTPPLEAFAEELRDYPRASENVPSWLSERAGAGAGSTAAQPAIQDDLPPGPAPGAAMGAGAQPAAKPGELRHAEVFDESGNPFTHWPAIPPQERAQLIEYLESAPVVLAARSFDTDRLDPAGNASVPLTFHTDGTWIWPGALGYYLRQHDVAPEPGLVEGARSRGFQVPMVDDETKELAVSVITGDQSG